MKNVSLRQYNTARNLDVDESGDLVITGNRVLFGLIVSNLRTSSLFLKLYDKATAPTVGTDTPKMTLALPTLTFRYIPLEGGIPFSLGIGVGATTAIADADAGAPAANECSITALYL
ncbi:MAG: hypothetical protein MUP81_02200 [Dehalococcoidia bacterium]|nr:hypothetical protein [Dehalococcoidia bacterium]